MATEPKDVIGAVEDAEGELTEADAALRVEQHRRTSSELRRMNRLLTTELEMERAKAETLLQIRDAKPGSFKIKPPRKRGGKNPAVTVALASDLHVEERVDPKTVSWRNETNLEIAEQRLSNYWKRVAKLVKKQQVDCSINRHVQWLGGDLFSGHIHEDLVEICDLTPTQAILWLREHITAGLDYLAKELDVEKIVVPCNYGNHGRTTIKPRISTAADHSWEWLLYQVLDSDYAENDRIEFLISGGYHLHLDLNGFVVRFHHGDGLKYGGGVGGLHIPLRKRVDAWNDSQKADLDVLGHWHQLSDLQYAIVNGSLIGHNAYAIRIGARFEPPQQAFFCVDLERRRKFGTYPIWVD